MLNIKILIIITVSILVLSIGICVSVNMYRKSKCKEAIQNTTIAMQKLENNVKIAFNVINKTQFILVIGEKESLEIDVNNSKEKIDPIKKEIEDAIRLADVQQVRSLLEPGFTENTITPIDKINGVTTEIERVINFCNNRTELRNRSLDNEMLLKATLKKPIVDAIELPSELVGIPAKYLNMIPRNTNSFVQQLSTLDPALNNSLGVKLLIAAPIVETIKKDAKTEMIKQNAQNMWNSARDSFSAVKPLNDSIHWYVPKQDDGKYNSDTYTKLLSQQKPALDAISRGNSYLEFLTAYCVEVHNQYVVFISSNTYDDTSFKHSRSVKVVKSRRNSQGEREEYITHETQYYHTDGRIFYYTKTTISNTGVNTERIKVGSKDSHGIMGYGWREWDYNIDQRPGYLVEYKEYGLDNTGIIRGGTYTPLIHKIKG